MINAKTFLHLPMDFHGKFKIYPPTVEEVIGNDKYGLYYKTLTMDELDIMELYKDSDIDVYPTPFEFLLMSCHNSKEYQQIVSESFEFFIHQPAKIFEKDKQILIGDVEKALDSLESLQQIRFLEENEFFDFQNAIRSATGHKEVVPEDPTEPPRVREIKRRARLRDKIIERKGRKGGISLDTTLVAICCMGIGLNPLNIGEMSYAAVHPLMEMMQDKEKYDLDIKALLAGADSKKIKPKYWIKEDEN